MVRDCIEHGEVAIDLSDLIVGSTLQIYPEVLSQNLFRLGLAGNKVKFCAAGFVGLIPITPEVAIRVKPKISSTNLDYMLMRSLHVPVVIEGHFQDYEVARGSSIPIGPNLIDMLIASVEAIACEGIASTYLELESTGTSPRGRIRIGESLLQSVRTPMPTLRYVETVRRPWKEVNCWLISGLLRCSSILTSSRNVSANREKLARIGRVVRLLGHTGPLEELPMRRPLLPEDLEAAIQAVHRSGRHYYVTALRLVRAIVFEEAVSFQRLGSALHGPTMLIDMARVFEGYIMSIVGEISRGVSVKFGEVPGDKSGAKPFFDQKGTGVLERTMATPDIVLEAPNCVLPADVKYKIYRSTPAKEDWSQALGYSLSYGSSNAVLIHPVPESGQKGLIRLGEVGSRSLLSYAFDVEAVDLKAEEVSLQEALLSLLAHPSD